MSLTWHTLGLNKRSIHLLCMSLSIYIFLKHMRTMYICIYIYLPLFCTRIFVAICKYSWVHFFYFRWWFFFLSFRLHSERLWIKVYFWVFIITLAGVVVFAAHFLPWRVVVANSAMSISLWGIKTKNDLRVWWLFVW